MFFQRFDNEEIIESDIHAKISLERKDWLMILQFNIDGRVKTLCDRCGDEVWTNIESDEELIARFGNETDLTNDEVIYLDNSEFELDVTQFLFEFCSLAIPSKRVQSEGKCAQDITEYLEEGTQEEETEINDYIDPRWEALKKLK